MATMIVLDNMPPTSVLKPGLRYFTEVSNYNYYSNYFYLTSFITVLTLYSFNNGLFKK